MKKLIALLITSVTICFCSNAQINPYLYYTFDGAIPAS